MLWQKRIRGGLLLYALLMLSIFSLLLQFYLNRQVAQARTHQAARSALEAYAMAHWTKEKLKHSLVEATSANSKKEDHALTQVPEEAKTNKSEEVQVEIGEEGNLPSALSQAEATELPRAELSSNSYQILKPEVSNQPLLDAGQLVFHQGQVNYTYEAPQLVINVQLKGGQTYVYRFHINSEKS